MSEQLITNPRKPWMDRVKGFLPSAAGVKTFATSYVLTLAAAIGAVGMAYQYADIGPDGKRDLKGSWKSWAYGLGSVALVTFILGSLGSKVKPVKDIVTDRFAQAVMMLTAGLIAAFDVLLEPAIRANPDGYVAKIFFAPGAVIDKVASASAKASLIGYSAPPAGGGAPADGGISTTPASAPVTGASTPNQADPLSAIASAINQIGSQIEMATQPVGGSVPGGTAGIGYGGWATSMQGLSGAGDGVFNQLVRMSPM